MTSALQPELFSRRFLAWVVGVAMFACCLRTATFFVSPFIVIALPVFAIVAMLLLRWPWLGVAMLIASVPAQQIGAVGGGSLTMTRASIVAAFFGLVILWSFARRPIIGSRLTVPFICLIGWMIVTTHVARDFSASSADLIRWLIALFAFLAALQVLVGARQRVIAVLILTIAVVGALEAGFGTALGLLGLGPESFLVQDAFSRAYGTFGRPNTFAGYLEIAVFPVLWYGLFRLREASVSRQAYVGIRRSGFANSARERRNFVVDALFAAVLLGSASMMLGGILISFSRGAWIGVLAGMSVTSIVAARRFWHLLGSRDADCGAFIAVALTLFAPATLTDRLSSIAEEARPFDAASITITPDNFAVVERMAHWQAGWQMFLDHPVTGDWDGKLQCTIPRLLCEIDVRIFTGPCSQLLYSFAGRKRHRWTRNLSDLDVEFCVRRTPRGPHVG